MNDASTPPNAPRRTVGAGATVTSGASFATAAVGGAMGILVARLLGPADTGAYNVAISTLLVLLTAGTLGLNIGTAYHASRGWAAGDAFRQLQLAAAALGIVSVGLALGVATLTRDSLFEDVPLATVALAAAAVPFALSWTFGSSVALALDRYEAYALVPFAANAAALAVAAVAVPLAGLEGAAAAVVAGHASTALGLLAWGYGALPRARPGWLRRAGRDLRRAVGFGLRSYAPQVLQLLNYRADLFILNAVAPRAQVGHYAVALVVTELGLLAPRSLSAVVVPRVASLDAAATGPERDFVIGKSVRHAVLLVPLTTLALAVAVLSIPLVFGSDFSDAVGPGLVLAPGVAVLGVGSVLMANTFGRGQPQLALRGALIVPPLTLVLYALLVPALEIWGAATASTCSYTASALVSLFYFRRATQGVQLGRLLPGRDELSDYRLVAERARRRLARAPD
jgi:O-antigen/teichoic acid export membrane protein